MRSAVAVERKCKVIVTDGFVARPNSVYFCGAILISPDVDVYCVPARLQAYGIISNPEQSEHVDGTHFCNAPHTSSESPVSSAVMRLKLWHWSGSTDVAGNECQRVKPGRLSTYRCSRCA